MVLASFVGKKRNALQQFQKDSVGQAEFKSVEHSSTVSTIGSAERDGCPGSLLALDHDGL